MTGFSRRQLARYAVDELLAKCQTAALAKRLAAALAASGRAKEIDLLLSDIDKELEDRGLVARTRLTSARPLSANLRNELIAKLKKTLAIKEITLEQQLDKTVIGGLKIETANHSWDKTTKRLLMQLKEKV